MSTKIYEYEYRKKIIKYCKNKGCVVSRLEPGSETGIRGIPDLVLFRNDFHVKFIEVKTPTGKLSAEQKNILRKLGPHGTVIYGYDTEKINKFLKGEIEDEEY